MKLTKIESLILAEKVLNLLQNSKYIHSICDKSIEGSIECYQNGREHGFVLWNFFADFNGEIGTFLNHKAYYICMGRNGDSIYIYKGGYAMQSISEDAYRSAHSFRYENEIEAAEWLATDIQKEYLAEQARLNK